AAGAAGGRAGLFVHEEPAGDLQAVRLAQRAQLAPHRHRSARGAGSPSGHLQHHRPPRAHSVAPLHQPPLHEPRAVQALLSRTDRHHYQRRLPSSFSRAAATRRAGRLLARGHRFVQSQGQCCEWRHSSRANDRQARGGAGGGARGGHRVDRACGGGGEGARGELQDELAAALLAVPGAAAGCHGAAHERHRRGLRAGDGRVRAHDPARGAPRQTRPAVSRVPGGGGVAGQRGNHQHRAAIHEVRHDAEARDPAGRCVLRAEGQRGGEGGAEPANVTFRSVCETHAMGRVLLPLLFFSL
ncbi:hypothetical protein BLSTO_02945, partial [Blastocystis sp. subtype 1]